jgi:hypothetical protein
MKIVSLSAQVLIVTALSACSVAPDEGASTAQGDEVASLSSKLSSASSGFYWYVQNGYGRYLDGALQSIGSNGTKVQLWDFNGGDQQLWYFLPLGGDEWEILNAHSSSWRCLDAALQSIGQNGTTVQLWDCNGGTQQRWRISSDDTVRNVQSGRCLDAALQSIQQNGTKMQLWDCNGGDQQKWY